MLFLRLQNPVKISVNAKRKENRLFRSISKETEQLLELEEQVIRLVFLVKKKPIIFLFLAFLLTVYCSSLTLEGVSSVFYKITFYGTFMKLEYAK
jgi:hypothetical protein